MEIVNLSMSILCFAGMFIPQQERWLTITFFMLFLTNFFFALPALFALFS